MIYTVRVIDLIDTLKANRAAHREIYEEAVVAYREKALAETSDLIDRLTRGEVLRVSLALPVPEDHTDDYDRAIRMLEMTLAAGEEFVDLRDEEAERFVMDRWGWQRSWTDNTLSYASPA